MDHSLSKGLAKEFVRRAGTISEERFDKLGEIFSSNESSINKRFKKAIENFNSEKNNYVINRAEFGPKANPGIGLTYLKNTNYNQALERSEPMIYGQQHFIFKKPPVFVASPSIQFSVGQHLIQRLIERHPEIKSFDYNAIFDLIRRELKFVTIYSCIIRYFLSLGTQRTSIPNKVIHGEKPLHFPIPSGNGMFWAHVYRGVPFLRTFKSLAEMNDIEIKLRSTMVELTEVYCSTSFPYYFEYAIQFESKVSNSNSKFYQALFFLSIIFVDFRDIFKSLIPDALGDILPVGQKKEVIEKLLSLTEEFPLGEDNSELLGLNLELRKAIENKKSLEFFRRLTITLTNLYHKKNFLSKDLRILRKK